MDICKLLETDYSNADIINWNYLYFSKNKIDPKLQHINSVLDIVIKNYIEKLKNKELVTIKYSHSAEFALCQDFNESKDYAEFDDKKVALFKSIKVDKNRQGIIATNFEYLLNQYFKKYEPVTQSGGNPSSATPKVLHPETLSKRKKNTKKSSKQSGGISTPPKNKNKTQNKTQKKTSNNNGTDCKSKYSPTENEIPIIFSQSVIGSCLKVFNDIFLNIIKQIFNLDEKEKNKKIGIESITLNVYKKSKITENLSSTDCFKLGKKLRLSIYNEELNITYIDELAITIFANNGNGNVKYEIPFVQIFITQNLTSNILKYQINLNIENDNLEDYKIQEDLQS